MYPVLQKILVFLLSLRTIQIFFFLVKIDHSQIATLLLFCLWCNCTYGCFCESFRRPKALTGGQSHSSLVQDTPRLQMNPANPDQIQYSFSFSRLLLIRYIIRDNWGVIQIISAQTDNHFNARLICIHIFAIINIDTCSFSFYSYETRFINCYLDTSIQPKWLCEYFNYFALLCL